MFCLHSACSASNEKSSGFCRDAVDRGGLNAIGGAKGAGIHLIRAIGRHSRRKVRRRIHRANAALLSLHLGIHLVTFESKLPSRGLASSTLGILTCLGAAWLKMKEKGAAGRSRASSSRTSGHPCQQSEH